MSQVCASCFAQSSSVELNTIRIRGAGTVDRKGNLFQHYDPIYYSDFIKVNRPLTRFFPEPAFSGFQDRCQFYLVELFRGMVEHNGVSELRVDVKPLKKGRKDVVLSSGKDYHFVLKPAQTPVADGNPGD